MLTWLEQQNEKTPEKKALYTSDGAWTVGQLYQEVMNYSKKLATLLTVGEKRVALLSHNSFEMYVMILSLWSLGKEIVFLNTHLVESELAYQLEDSQVKTVFLSDDLLGKKLGQQRLISFSDVKRQLATNINSETNFSLDNTASIMYTSGTTGKPKGVVQTFRNHYASSLATQKNMSVTSKDIWACAVPLFHISGLSIVIRQLVLGCSVYLLEKFDATKMTDLFKTGQATISSVVNVMLKQLLAEYPTTGYHQQFKCMLVGGGPVSKEMLQACFDRKIPVIQSFGMTETCSQVVALSYNDALRKIGSSGLPLDGIKLTIRQGERLCQPFEIGEILLSGENISLSYLNQEPQNPSYWSKDGYFRTGDLGYLDEEGYLYVVSRLSELIISGGENIYPAEIEHCIESISEVKEVAVVGEADDEWGEVPVAYLVLKSQLDVQKIDEVCQQSLAKYKCPKRYYVIEQLPRTASGKVAKKLLLKH